MENAVKLFSEDTYGIPLIFNICTFFDLFYFNYQNHSLHSSTPLDTLTLIQQDVMIQCLLRKEMKEIHSDGQSLIGFLVPSSNPCLTGVGQACIQEPFLGTHSECGDDANPFFSYICQLLKKKIYIYIYRYVCALVYSHNHCVT
jgi:hypothetical protein